MQRQFTKGTAAVTFLAAVTLALTACGSDGKRSAPAEQTEAAGSSTTPSTATETVTSTTPACPVDEAVCTFARQTAGLIRAGRYEDVAAQAHPLDYTCPGDKPAGAGGPFPLCDGAAAGDRRPGYSVGALQSEGSVVSRSGLVEVLTNWVSANKARSTVTAGNQPALATVGCPLVGEAAVCSDRFVFVLIRGDGTSLLRFGVQRDGTASAPQITQTMTGVITVNQKLVSGGDDDLPVIFGVEQGVGTRYFVAH